MNSSSVPIKNLVLEWRYAPNLATYAKMDQIGLDFLEDYPDWERSPLTLELRNKQHRRRFYLSFRRCFYEAVEPNDGIMTEINRASKLWERVSNDLGIKTIQRVGFRLWAAYKREETFEELVERSAKKFQPENSPLNDVLHGEVEDVAYVVNVKAHNDWKYTLRAGPMEKKQWFEIIPYEVGLFPSPKELLEYRDKFPDRFLYIDIDCSKEESPASDFSFLKVQVPKEASEVITGIHKYFSS